MEERLWNVVYKLIAKNYYIAFDHTKRFPVDKPITFEIKQRKKLFNVCWLPTPHIMHIFYLFIDPIAVSLHLLYVKWGSNISQKGQSPLCQVLLTIEDQC